ncbi:MAG: type VI secretion system contractile sheath large subunit [Bryobacterales bacterium]|nr:type VI secretion system contractile sheath large subunit [Bryobacterales bacterium]
MPRSDEFVSVVLDVDAGAQPQMAEPDEETPFRILILGNFGGQARPRKPVDIDRDNFDDVMAAMDVRLDLGRGAALQFRELEDFHPDRIHASLPLFREPAEAPPPAAPTRKAADVDMGSLAGGSLLDDILNAGEPNAAPGRAPTHDPMQEFLRQAVAPHLEPREDPGARKQRAAADEAAGQLMRALLHSTKFQALEAAWRGLFLLIRRLDTNSLLKVYVQDRTREDLAELLPAAPDDGGWSVVAGLYSFGQSAQDIALLRALARSARAAGAPFVSEGDLGQAEAEAWETLRHAPEASWIGLALPRFLLRLPYGTKTAAVESFPFEEIQGVPAHSDYLWGNAALACACLLGEAFSRDGWRMRPGAARELGDMPLHVYDEDGETRLRPPVELAMTPPDAEWALDEGYMPLIWLRGQDSIRLVRFQSIADPAAPLSGRWG